MNILRAGLLAQVQQSPFPSRLSQWLKGASPIQRRDRMGITPISLLLPLHAMELVI